ncbi:PREDICTED: uncharacterized protein LOC106820781 [Priapulus caudatus]|uniref:Uncharacterized protein LOC106820781 n=1 Tax=Priapulus caudatus TaxID=37621 RepID=A0ABM1F8R6_PRICU|nr:PREDICTED: uncharacterized protein LOC106820781 [Priapulus caudatus]
MSHRCCRCRCRGVEKASEHLILYQQQHPEEKTWVSNMQLQVKHLPRLAESVVQARAQFQPAMNMYNALGERKPSVEQVNRDGGRYIREAKIYDLKLRAYRRAWRTCTRASTRA